MEHGKSVLIKVLIVFNLDYVVYNNGMKIKNNTIKKTKGYFYDKDGYKIIYKDHKKVREHRIIMEQFLGRKLEKFEQVHHINGNILDNRIENLLLTTNKEHHKFHPVSDETRKLLSSQRKGVKKSPEHIKKLIIHLEKIRKLRKLVNWSRKYRECVICGTNKIKHKGKGLCRKCFSKKYNEVCNNGSANCF